MNSLFNSTKNTRFLPDETSKYIRSDVPDYLDEKEIEWLLENNVLTIIDLRTKKERLEKPCKLANMKNFQYYNIEVTGGNNVPFSEAEVSKSYLSMVDDKMLEIINIIENAKTNVLYFCNAGKDRTGVVSAILLSRMKIKPEIIIEDYLKSAINLKEVLEAYSKQNPQVKLDIITPKALYIQEFLNKYKL